MKFLEDCPYPGRDIGVRGAGGDTSLQAFQCQQTGEDMTGHRTLELGQDSSARPGDESGEGLGLVSSRQSGWERRRRSAHGAGWLG